MAADARKEIDGYKTAGGAAGAADHPAIKWSAALWAIHDQAPQSEAGALAAVEAIRLLVRAELWDRAHARVASLDADEPAWERVPSTLYEEGIARKNFDYTIDDAVADRGVDEDRGEQGRRADRHRPRPSPSG